MNLTLLVETNVNLESFYRLNLTTWLGLELVTKSDLNESLPYIEEVKDTLQLIIIRSTLKNKETAKEIISYLNAKNLDIPVIVIGRGNDVDGNFAHIPNSLQLKLVIQACARALGITAQEMMTKVVPDFYPIPLFYFKNLKRSICPVYIKDPKDPKKYILHIEKLKEFEIGYMGELTKNGHETLYVDKMDRLEFVNNLSSELITKLAETDLSSDEQVSATDKSMELLSRKLLSIGLNEETIALSRKNMDAIQKNVKSSPKLAKLLERLLSNKTSYLFKHTQILTYISLHIVKNIDWGTPEQEEKIAFISFFHDIALETDEQARIKTTLELKKSSLTAAEKSLVDRHAQLAAELISKFPRSPMGADQIIRQHHGTLNGIGFSEHYGNNVSPLSIVFIVAEEFTRIILSKEDGVFDRTEMLRELKDEFPTNRFQKTIDLLSTITF